MDATPRDLVGSVCLVGAGPGDPGLITVRGRDCLRRADVVVFDALSPPALLDEAAPDAERIDAGKRARHHRLTQDQINALLLDRARRGLFVVRLKGGDPYLFGRGAEEVAFLGRHGVACEVVSGVTAGIAAATTGGVPVTHRRHASSVTFVTGHEDPSKGVSSLDFTALAALVRGGGTLCIYMGMGRLAPILETLAAQGLDASTPVTVIADGTLPRQAQVRTTLADGAAAVRASGLGPPSIVVVGAVAGVEDPGLDWFMRRPLFGQRIVITRTRHQASRLRRALEVRGAEVYEAPTIRIAPPADPAAVDVHLAEISRFDWLLLTSANAAAALADRMRGQGLDARSLAGLRVAAIGATTAGAIEEHLAVRPDHVPETFTGEMLARSLIDGFDMAGARALWWRADIARPDLARILTEAGVKVTVAEAYTIRPVTALPPTVVESLREGSVNWVTFTSAATAQNMAALLGDEQGLLRQTRLASIGPITSAAIRELGYEPAAEADPHDIDGLVEAICRHPAPDVAG